MKRMLWPVVIATALVAAVWFDCRLWLGRKGYDLYRSGDFSGAFSTWRRQRAAGAEEASFNCGAAAYRMGNYSAAIHHFRSSSATTQKSLRHKALYDLGTAHLRLPDGRNAKSEAAESHLREAVTSLQQSLALAPSSASAAENLKVARTRLLALQKARGELRQGEREAVSRKERTEGEGETSSNQKQTEDGAAKPGKATSQDQEGARKRAAPLDKNQALRMLDEARGREALRSAVAASAPRTPATPVEKDW